MRRRTVLVGGRVTLSAAFAGYLGGSYTTTEGENETDDDTSETKSESGNDSVTGSDSEEVVEEEPRVDEPVHEIERPESPDDPEDYDDWNDQYLGENMATEPTLDFDSIPAASAGVRERGFGGTVNPDDTAYQVRVVANKADYEATFDEDKIDDDIRDRLDTVDLDESIFVVVESGWGSGSFNHRWARVEADAGVIHLHGYYSKPYEQTDDLDTRLSVLEVERPNDLDFARVSLTVSEPRRVHFNSTEGIVKLE